MPSRTPDVVYVASCFVRTTTFPPLPGNHRSRRREPRYPHPHPNRKSHHNINPQLSLLHLNPCSHLATAAVDDKDLSGTAFHQRLTRAAVLGDNEAHGACIEGKAVSVTARQQDKGRGGRQVGEPTNGKRRAVSKFRLPTGKRRKRHNTSHRGGGSSNCHNVLPWPSVA